MWSGENVPNQIKTTRVMSASAGLSNRATSSARQGEWDSPRVSICGPNLERGPFLEERLDTIFRQSLKDWELIFACDPAQDGASEYFEAVAQRDARLRVQPARFASTCEGWNHSVRQ